MEIEANVTSPERFSERSFRRNQFLLSVVLLGLAWADWVITCFIIKSGFAWEGNPLIRDYVTDSGFWVIKLFGTLVAVLILWDVFRKYPKFTLTLSQVIVGVYTLIVWWNVYIACNGILH